MYRELKPGHKPGVEGRSGVLGGAREDFSFTFFGGGLSTPLPFRDDGFGGRFYSQQKL